MHDWGDRDFHYWHEIEDAINLIDFVATKLGRVGGQKKEKYGTVRFYSNIHYQLHDLIYPGYAYCQFPRWLWKIDCLVYTKYIYPIARHIIHPYQMFMYRLAYKLAALKYPMIYHEIYMMADWQEVLEKDYPFKNYWKSGDENETT